MCGIAGYININHRQNAEPKVINGMISTLTHRGPDYSSCFVHENVALGHSRLSIIDLSPNANQPMCNEDGTIWIVFNGELYNYRQLRKKLEKKGHIFKSQSDTEVLVHGYEEWDLNCFQLFDGMMAVAIYDQNHQCLILAKDRFGKKPLYYTMQNGVFAFASEIKALRKHPNVNSDISHLAVIRYLAYEYTPTPDTIYKDINKLDAAQYIKIPVEQAQEEDLKPQSYWELDFLPKLEISFEDAQKRFREIFTRAVEKRLESDVPLGVFLSGGIDSSSIVWAMAEIMDAAAIKTFTIGFRDSSFDESSHASLVANYFGTNHRSKTFDIDSVLNILPKVVSLLDEPFADASILPTYLLSKFTREYVTVALGGDGGDELFAGYDPFIAQRFAPWLEHLPGPVFDFFRRIVDQLPVSNKNMSIDFRVKHFLKGFSPETKQVPELRNQVWLGPCTINYLISKFNGHYSYETIYEPTLSKINTRLETIDRLSNIYLKTYLHDDILVKIDRASMMNSLEVRSPFLDTELAEFVARLPVQYKMQGLSTKYLMKQAFNGYLPDSILNRPKKGFGIPLSQWLRKELYTHSRTAIDNLSKKLTGIFNPLLVQDILEDHRNGIVDRRKEIWGMMMLNDVCLSEINEK